MKRQESLQKMENTLGEFQEESERHHQDLDTWSQIFVALVDAGGQFHGSKKEPETSWVQFFERIIGRPIERPPASLCIDGLSFENILDQISMVKKTLRDDVTKVDAKSVNFKKRLDKKRQTIEKYKQAAHDKVSKVLQNQASGENLVIEGEKKKLCVYITDQFSFMPCICLRLENRTCVLLLF